MNTFTQYTLPNTLLEKNLGLCLPKIFLNLKWLSITCKNLPKKKSTNWCVHVCTCMLMHAYWCVCFGACWFLCIHACSCVHVGVLLICTCCSMCVRVFIVSECVHVPACCCMSVCCCMHACFCVHVGSCMLVVVCWCMFVSVVA